MVRIRSIKTSGNEGVGGEYMGDPKGIGGSFVDHFAHALDFMHFFWDHHF